ncbi:MAG: type 2a secretion system protein GspJ [Rhodobacteraceae bacterium HLUCCA12]|nr:MAG: type 2a secretion system protein GspJ [Rhodobacteraceae bacterium HLUCCA12]
MTRRVAFGFTLIELIAVLAIFALVSVMALQALTGAIRQRSAMTRIDDEAATLARALVMLRRDFDAAVPIAFHPPQSDPEPALAPQPEAGRVALSIGGHPQLPGEPGAGLARVIWRHDPVERTLTRQVWPVLNPARGDLIGPERVILDGIAGLEFEPRGEWPEREQNLSSLPEGFEVSIATDRYGTLDLVVAR